MVLINYHKRNTSIQKRGHCFEGQGHYDSKSEHFVSAISESLQWFCFLLHSQKINGKRKPNIDLWVKRSKVNLPANLSLHFISDGISLRLYITDASNFENRWRMMIRKHLEQQRSKRLLVKVGNGCFAIELCVFVILVNSASISLPYMQFVIKVWWTFSVLKYYLSVASIILHVWYPNGEISWKSCNSFKSTYRSFASLNLVQSRQSNSITTCITFTSVKKTSMFLYFINYYGKLLFILFLSASIYYWRFFFF